MTASQCYEETRFANKIATYFVELASGCNYAGSLVGEKTDWLSRLGLKDLLHNKQRGGQRCQGAAYEEKPLKAYRTFSKTT